MSTELSTEKYYDQIADGYDVVSERRRLYNSAVDHEISFIRKNKKSDIMLDIGSGNGLRAKKLSQAMGVKKLYLSDISNKMLNLCRHNVPGSETIDLKSTSLESLDISFDIITMQWNVLGHVSSFNDRVKLLEHCRNRLASGGQVFLDINNRHNIIYGKLRVLMRCIIDYCLPNYERGNTLIGVQSNGKSVKGFGHLFTLNEIRNIVAKSGLKISKINYFDYECGTIRKHFFQGQIFCVLEAGE